MSKPGDLHDCYRTLEIEPGASREDVEQAHRELSKGWNPNRFGNDQKRRRRAEDKLRQINLAYERLLAEGDFDAGENSQATEAGPAQAVATTGPSRWSDPWWYMWIVAIVLALIFLGVDSAQRMKGINSISGPIIGNAPRPAKDPASLTGYYGNQHVQIMPALGTDGYHWIMQTERIVAGEEDLRMRHTDYDGLNDGREVHWSGSLHWLTMALAWIEHVTTGTPMTDSLQDVMPWANTTVLVLLILIIPAVVAWRFGWAPAALLALGFVVTYPYYEFSFIGYLDHHGLAASSDMLMVLFLVGAGATCLRDETAKTNRLTPAEKALWDWLPNRRRARHWIIASSIAGGTGLWISAASVIPPMFGIGLAALASSFWMSLGKPKQTYWRMDPTLWRVWGLAGAGTSLFYYALEYLPFHFGWRLEVNHPLYALAWFGAGDLICRLCQLMQGSPESGERSNPGVKWVWMAVDLLLIASLPLALALFGEKVFVIPDKFLMLLHKDYILEFRTFIFQMSFLQPVQVAGGISLLPLVFLPLTTLLFFGDVPKPWKAVILVALLPTMVMLLLSLVYIRWLGIDCAVSLAALAALVLVVVRTWSNHSWGYIFAFIAVVVVAALPVILPVLDRSSLDEAKNALNIYLTIAALLTVALTAFAVAKVSDWKVYLIFGITALWQLFSWGVMLQQEWGKKFIANNIFLANDIMRSKEHIELLSTQQGKSIFFALAIFLLLTAFISFPAILTGLAGMLGFNWNARETRRSIFLGLLVYFLALVVLPFPLFQYLQWHTTRWTPSPSDLDLTQAVTRDVSHRLRLRLGDERGVIVSGPTTTTWMMYFGGFKGIGTLYWENIAGLKTAANIYSKNSTDSHDLIKKYGVTHIAIFSWDAFAIEYARLAQGRTKKQDAPAGAFVLDLVQTRSIPSWLRPLPYRVPDHPKLAGSMVLLFEVVPDQTLEEAQLHIAEWLIAFGTVEFLDKAESQLRSALQAHPNYLPALSLLAILQQSRGQTEAMRATAETIQKNLDQAASLKFEDRVTLAIALFLAGDMAEADKQTQAYLAMAEKDENLVRRLSIDRMANFLELAGQFNHGQPLPKVYADTMNLLPPALQAQVKTERANLLYNSDPPRRAEAVALLREALQVQPDFESAITTLVRILSSSSDPSLRNGKEAVQLAKGIFDRVRAQNPGSLDLLACAEAEAGNFEDARFYETQAVQLAENGNRPETAEYARRLDLFLKNQPFHEP